MDYKQDVFYRPRRQDMSKIPFYMAYPMQTVYMEEMEYARDLEKLKGMYPKEVRSIQEMVEDECDKMEYEGSLMFDEYPDRLMVNRIVKRIYDASADNQPEIQKYEVEQCDMGQYEREQYEEGAYEEMQMRMDDAGMDISQLPQGEQALERFPVDEMQAEDSLTEELSMEEMAMEELPLEGKLMAQRGPGGPGGPGWGPGGPGWGPGGPGGPGWGPGDPGGPGWGPGGPGRPPQPPRNNGLQNLIEVLLFNEMYQRRCRHKRCRRWW